MKKFRFLSVMLALVLVFVGFTMAFVGCDNSGDDGGSTGNPGGNPGGNPSEGTGWPPANVLAQYGVSGMSAPSDARDFQWGVDSEGDLTQLAILFTGSQATDNSVHNWFTGHGWTVFLSNYDDGEFVEYYMKSNFQAVYVRTNNPNYNCLLTIAK